MAAIGIDLGTTYSAVAVVQRGKVDVIANELGFFTTASYVAFNDAERLVGDAAKKQAPLNPTNTIYNSKRLIGRNYNDAITQEEMQNLSYKVIDANGTPKIRVNFKKKKRDFFIEEISAMILTKMKQTAEAYLNKPVKDAVITVPAYFNNSQRQATKDAARIAGLNVLQIINEPTAAAIAYRFERREINYTAKKNVLIFDLGGGTLDVTALSMENMNAKVLSTAGDPHLGGEDFDNHIVNYMVNEFQRKHGKNIRDNKNALRRLRSVCEQEKRILSTATQTTIQIDSLCDGINFIARLTRPRFEELNADLFKKALKPVEQALFDASLSKEDIDEIILVGGSSRIPKIQKLLKDYFGGKELNRSINPDEAVAYGAAVQAAIKKGDFSLKVFGLVMQDITPLSLGIGSEDNFKTMSFVIKKNSPIPVKRTKQFSTLYNNQTAITFPVYQGESTRTANNHLLGTFELKGFPPASRGLHGADVTFQLDANGILLVTAVDKLNSNNNSFLKIENTSQQFSDKQLKKIIKDQKKLEEEEKQLKLAIEARNALESELFEINSSLENGAMDGVKAKLKRECEDSIEWLERTELAGKEVYEERIKKIRKLNNGSNLNSSRMID